MANVKYLFYTKPSNTVITESGQAVIAHKIVHSESQKLLSSKLCSVMHEIQCLRYKTLCLETVKTTYMENRSTQ